MSYTMNRPLEEKIEIMRINERVTSEHSHNFLEMVYVCSGVARHSIGDKKGILKAGDFFVIDYETYHSYQAEDDNLNIINCLFLPEIIDKSFAGVKNFNELCEGYFFRIAGRKINGPASNTVYHDDGAVGELFVKMFNEYEDRKDGYHEKLRCLLCEIIIETVRKVGSQVKISPLTTKILEELEKDFKQPVTLGALCERFHYSLSYVSSKFRSDTGFTFTEYLQNRRIEESCRLLSYTDMQISQIAEETGYSSIKFFNKIFKKVTGLTPREYRKLNS